MVARLGTREAESFLAGLLINRGWDRVLWCKTKLPTRGVRRDPYFFSDDDVGDNRSQDDCFTLQLCTSADRVSPLADRPSPCQHHGGAQRVLSTKQQQHATAARDGVCICPHRFLKRHAELFLIPRCKTAWLKQVKTKIRVAYTRPQNAVQKKTFFGAHVLFHNLYPLPLASIHLTHPPPIHQSIALTTPYSGTCCDDPTGDGLELSWQEINQWCSGLLTS